MSTSVLASLTRPDEHGRGHFLIVENAHGEYVLTAPEEPLREDRRPLDGLDCMRLAALGPAQPRPVVENPEGDYVVLVDGAPNLDRHTPLNPDDADVLAGPDAPVGRFGRRDDDIVALTAWVEEDQAVTFDAEAPEFADVPLVTLADGALAVERGEVDAGIAPLVLEHLRDRGEDAATRFGVFANPFGEFVCVPVGATIEPHEDLRHQAVLRGRSLMDGATTLSEAAAMLRAFADRLEAAETAGWQLDHRVTDDHGFPERRG